MITKFLNLSRFYKKAMMILFDQIILLFALFLAFFLRFSDEKILDTSQYKFLFYMQINWWLFVVISIITTFFFNI